NRAQGMGTNSVAGGIDISQSNAAVTNCILYGDTAASYNEMLAGTDATCTLAYSDVEGGVPASITDGGHNISADPLFVRAPGANGDGDDGDLHLQPSSPCVNAGSASAPSLPGFDMDGHARSQGGAPDIGADEVGT